MEALQVERALFSQARWSRRPIQDVAKDWDSYPLRPKPRIVFKDVAKEIMCEAAVGRVFSDEPSEWEDTMISAGEKILRMAERGAAAARPPAAGPGGSSEDGKSFAARHAEAIFTAHQTFERASDFYGDIKARTAAAGRDPDDVLVLPGVVPIIGSTEHEHRSWQGNWTSFGCRSTDCGS